MFKVNDYLIYKHEVCQVREIKEKYLYNEFMIVMNMEYEEVKKCVIDEVKRLVK